LILSFTAAKIEVDPRAVELRGGLLMDHTLRM
jgi:hypothetical protein